MIEGYTSMTKRKTRFSFYNECIEMRLDDSTSTGDDSDGSLSTRNWMSDTKNPTVPAQSKIQSHIQSPCAYNDRRDVIEDYLRSCSDDVRDMSLDDPFVSKEVTETDGQGPSESLPFLSHGHGHGHNAAAIVNMAEVERSLDLGSKRYNMYLSNVTTTDLTIPSTTRASSADGNGKREPSISETACLRLYSESKRRMQLHKEESDDNHKDIIHRQLRLSNEITATAKAFAFATTENWSNRLYQQAKERSARLAAKALIADDPSHSHSHQPFLVRRGNFPAKRINWNMTASTVSDTTCDYEHCDLDETKKLVVGRRSGPRPSFYNSEGGRLSSLSLGPTPEVCERLYNLGKQRLREKMKDNANTNDSAIAAPIPGMCSNGVTATHNSLNEKLTCKLLRDESGETVYQRLYRLAKEQQQEQNAEEQMKSVKGSRLHAILTSTTQQVQVYCRLFENEKVQEQNMEGRRRRDEIAATIAKRHELPDWSKYTIPMHQAEDVYHRNMARMLESEHRADHMARRAGKIYEPRYKFNLSMLGRYGWC